MLEKASNNLKPAMVKNLEINLLSLTHLPILCRARLFFPGSTPG